MRTLQNSELNSVVGGVVAGDDPYGKTYFPQRTLGESEAEYQARLLAYYRAIGIM